MGLFQSYWQENQLKAYSGRDVGWIAAVNSMFSFLSFRLCFFGLLGVGVGGHFEIRGRLRFPFQHEGEVLFSKEILILK